MRRSSTLAAMLFAGLLLGPVPSVMGQDGAKTGEETAPAGDAATGDAAAGDAAAGDAATGSAPADGTAPVAGAPADGAPVDGAPADGAPVDGAPVDGAPMDGAGAPKAAPKAPDPLEGIDMSKVDKPGEVYAVRIAELETKIGRLQQRTREARNKVDLLKSTLLGGKLAKSQAVIFLRNDMGSFFKLSRATLRLNSNVIMDRRNNGGDLADKKRLQAFSGALKPGKYRVEAYFKISGDGGVFSYFDGYEYEAKKACVVEVVEGKSTTLTLRLFDAGEAKKDKEPRVKCSSSKAKVSK